MAEEEEITLAGLKPTRIGGRAERGCREMVKVPMPSLKGLRMYRCKEYVDPDDVGPDAEVKVAGLEVFAEDKPRRKRGRPKGSTVKAGAKRPRLPRCNEETVDWEPVRRFKRKGNSDVEHRCRCNSSGNHNYVPDEVCERVVGPKPR